MSWTIKSLSDYCISWTEQEVGHFKDWVLEKLTLYQLLLPAGSDEVLRQVQALKKELEELLKMQRFIIATEDSGYGKVSGCFSGSAHAGAVQTVIADTDTPMNYYEDVERVIHGQEVHPRALTPPTPMKKKKKMFNKTK